jgi:hypothetical protein
MCIPIILDAMKANSVIAVGSHEIKADPLACVAFSLFHYTNKLNKFN